MWTLTDDGSVTDQDGRVIFFSIQRFVEDICIGGGCLICGSAKATGEFNDEHILPIWILRRYNLFDRRLVLPNGHSTKYGSYTIPCCAKCNSLLGKVLEHPISNAVKQGEKGLVDFISKHPQNLLTVFTWLALLFIKTHLRDGTLRLELDRRRGDEPISALYEWETLHHIHAVVRSLFTGASIHRDVFGSVFILPVKHEVDPPFDFVDLYASHTILISMDDWAILGVLNDSGGVMGMYADRVRRMTGPLSNIQLREVLAEIACLNLHISDRPRFRSEFDIEQETIGIVAQRPALAMDRLRAEVRGALLHRAVQDMLPYIRLPGVAQQDVEAAIKSGQVSFLFDGQGEFIRQHVAA